MVGTGIGHPEIREDAMANRYYTLVLACVGATMVLPATARADAIDGDWCAPDGPAQIHISGSNINTPSGTLTTGNNSRHAFSYIVPQWDPGSGDKVDMQLINEEEVRLTVNDGEPEIWRKCEFTS